MTRTSRARTGLRALWGWWIGCCLLFLCVWTIAFENSSLLYLKAREGAIAPKVSQLESAFDAFYESQQAFVTPFVAAFRKGQLTAQQLADAQQAGAPTLTIAVTDATGRPLLGSGTMPPMLVDLAVQRVARGDFLTPLRTTGPDGFLAFASRDASGRLFLANLDLAYLFGPWLSDEAHSLGLGANVALRPLEMPSAGYAAPSVPEGGNPFVAWQAILNGGEWRYEALPFFRNEAHPFRAVALDVDNRPRLGAIARTYGLILLGGSVLLAGFGAALRLASRLVAREMALAESRASFAAMVSHELKTPVAAVAMYAEILEHGLVEAPEQKAEYTRIIGREARRLGQLIENLLALGRLERAEQSFTLAPGDLNALVRRAVPHEGPVLELQASLPAALVEHEAATRAIANVVENALKYGGKPEDVLVRTACIERSLIVEIADRGPGIPASHRDAIFDPYVRLGREDTREVAGTGLGLALVKGYMTGQGGTVQVQEREGGGSVFRLSFRRAEET